MSKVSLPRLEPDYRFRIWDPVDQSYDHVTFHSFENLIDWAASQKRTDDGNGELDVKGHDLTGRIIEQWTGTTDKAGTPIFEGDIVDGTDSNGWELPPDHYRIVVEWSADRLMWLARDPWSGETFELGDYGPTDHVVGNVRENPELVAIVDDDPTDTAVTEVVP